MNVGRWTNTCCASPIIAWEPCDAYSWGVGTFWVQWTYNLLQTQYWWKRMQLQLQKFVFSCMVCDQIWVSFNAPTPHLQPLAIMGFGYQWSLHFANPLNLTLWHNRYVLVMIKHFSKWLELMLMLDHNSEGATYAFWERVLSKFRVLKEVLFIKVQNSMGNSKSCVRSIDWSLHNFIKPS